MRTVRGAEITGRIRMAYRAIAIGLALVQCWVRRFYMSPDGVSYLDLADAWWLRGEMAVNGYWDPLYSWVLGLVLRLVEPAPEWEAPVVHLVNFMLFLLALWAFERFWDQVGREIADGGLPQWAWLALGYPVFIWASLVLISVWEVTPDLLAAAILLWAARVMIEILTGSRGLGRPALLGGLLGFAYLAKTAMLPIAVMLLVCGVIMGRYPRRSTSGWLAASLVFVAIITPWVAARSLNRGELSLGDSGRLNYAWYVNGISDRGRHWQGGELHHGIATHPTRRLSIKPAIFEYAVPADGTYPPWYDPAYWHEGIEIRFEPGRQLVVLAKNLRILAEIVLRGQGIWILGVVALALLGAKTTEIGSTVQLFLLVSGALPPLMYAMVHVETRFLGAFMIFLAAAALLGVSWPSERTVRSWATRVVIVVAALALLPSFYDTARWVSKYRQVMVRLQGGLPHESWQVARGLRELGVEDGSSVAIIGYRIDSYWARLAGVRIVAEVDTALEQSAARRTNDSFWNSRFPVRRRALALLAASGATVVVVQDPPPQALLEGWQRLGTTSYFVLRL